MKVKKYIDPFSSQVHKMAKKFDVATIENKIEDISKLLVEAESLLDTQNRASQEHLYYSMGNISSKILVEHKVTSMLKRSLISKGMSTRDIDIKPAFIPEQKSIKHSVGIMSNIQNLEYMIEGEHIASIYTAKLYDLVELYNAKGEVLFPDNVRFQIADKLDVDKNIEATLREEPDQLIDDINTLYEGHKEAPYFYIARGGEQIKKDNVKVSDFAKLSALYLLHKDKIMEVRRFLYNRQNQNKLI